ncbi:hypothetical protein [Nocardiopsis synnemataformans]|uniref:hypothetical protein n=1 Tax=Nocardiopsis synnemataformans TaxID=61305 RepID=UPI003EC117F4
MREALVRTWNTFKLVVRALRRGTYATGGYLPPARPTSATPPAGWIDVGWVDPPPTRGEGEFGSPKRT